MTKPWDKVSPGTVYIKKEVLLFIIFFVALIVIIIMAGFNYLGKKNSVNAQTVSSKKNSIQKLADSSDTRWYKNHAQIRQPVLKPATSVTTLPVTNNSIATNKQVMVSTNFNDTLTEQKAMSAAINTNQIVSDENTITSNSLNNPTLSNNSTSTTNSSKNDDQNMQSEKKAFLSVNSQPNAEDYLSATVQNPISQYELQAGTIIPGLLITGINSDLPGQIIGQVRSNVYDTVSGNHILIPQGAKLIGIYDSQVAYGQERVLIAWQRIIMPNGQSIDLQGMPGADLSGYAGFNDEVDNHYVKIFGSVILMSLLSAGAQLSQPQNQTNALVNNTPTIGQTIAQSVGTNIANTGTMITQKNIDIQPTLIIRPGYEFNINVTKDMVFPGDYAG